MSTEATTNDVPSQKKNTERLKSLKEYSGESWTEKENYEIDKTAISR